MRDPSLWPLRFYFGAMPWIFYGPSHRKLRRYRGRVRLRVRGIGPGVALADGQPWHVSLMNMLIEAGVLMTPAVVTWKSFDPWQPGAWYPVLRYGGSFAVDNPLLTLHDHARNVDTRLQAVLSEELAVGFCGHVLRRAFGVAHIADAAPLIGKNLTWGAPGNRKRPDFLGRKPDGTLVIAEAKGTLGDMRGLSSRLKQGKRQVNSVKPLSSVPVERIVVGLELATVGESVESVGAVYDPPVAEDAEAFRLNADDLVRHAYAKTLASLGLYEHAERLVEGEPWNAIPDEPVDTFEVRGDAYVAPSPLVEMQAAQDEVTILPLLGIRRDIYEALSGGRDVVERVDEALASFPMAESGQEDEAIFFNNGVVVD